MCATSTRCWRSTARSSWYDKRHLVPFAEFFPVPEFVRSWLRLMSLPYCGLHARRSPTSRRCRPPACSLARRSATRTPTAATCCSVLPQADALVNVTNDAWFGHSSARHQHLQIARMRALEEGRYLVRAANDGISAVIGPHGEVSRRAPEFKPYALVSRSRPRAGCRPTLMLGTGPSSCLRCWRWRTGFWWGMIGAGGAAPGPGDGGSHGSGSFLMNRKLAAVISALAVTALALAACARAAQAPAHADPAPPVAAPPQLTQSSPAPGEAVLRACRTSHPWSTATGRRW